MPARSISRCDTISASYGFSLRMGRKKRDSLMGFPWGIDPELQELRQSKRIGRQNTREALEKPAKRPNYQRFYRSWVRNTGLSAAIYGEATSKSSSSVTFRKSVISASMRICHLPG